MKQNVLIILLVLFAAAFCTERNVTAAQGLPTPDPYPGPTSYPAPVTNTPAVTPTFIPPPANRYARLRPQLSTHRGWDSSGRSGNDPRLNNPFLVASYCVGRDGYFLAGYETGLSCSGLVYGVRAMVY